MLLDLEDIIKRRDYKLKFVWGCEKCKPNHLWDSVRIFLTRTTDEYERGESNINQICLKGHVTKPYKKCTKCGKIYTREDSKCFICEKYVLRKTELEVQIELFKKAVNRLKSQFKKKNITREEYTTEVFDIEGRMNIITLALLNLG